MFRIKLSKMAYEINDLKGILILVLFAIPMVASLNINCNGKAFHCVNSTHFMICVDLGGGVSTTIDDFVIPCPATTVCHKENSFECDFPKIEVVPPLQVLGVYKQSDTSEKTLVTDSVTTPTATSDIISEFIENVTATTLPMPEDVTPVLILEEHIQQPTQVDNGNTTDTSFPVTSSFVDNTNDIANSNQTNNNTIMTSTTDYPSFDTSTETSTDKVLDPLQDPTTLLDSVTSVTGTSDLFSVLPENVTTTTSLPGVSTLNYLNANISPTNYQNNTQQVTKQGGNAENTTDTNNIVSSEPNSTISLIADEVNTTPVDVYLINKTKDTMHLNKKILAKSNSTTASNRSSNLVPETTTSYLASTEIVNISESVTEGGSFRTTTDMSTLGLVDLILGTPSIHSMVSTVNNSHLDKNVATVDPNLTKQDINDSGSTIFSEAAKPTETILTEMLFSTEQISTTPSINMNLEGLNNTDINYNSSTEFNFTDRITKTENVPETTTKYVDLEPKAISSTQIHAIPIFVDAFKNESFLEVPTTVDQTLEIISTTDLPIVFNNNSYQINNVINQSLLSENNTSDVINTTEMIKTQYGVSNTEPTLLPSTGAKDLAIETPTAEKPAGLSQNEVSEHVIKVKNESPSTEGPYFTIYEQDIVEIDTSLPIYTTTVTNSVTEATVVTEDNPIFSAQFTEVTNKSPVTNNPTIVNEPKTEIVENNTVITIDTTEATNGVKRDSATKAIDNSMFSAQFTESSVTDNPIFVNEPKQETVEKNTVITTKTTDVAHDVRTNSVTKAIDNSMFSTQFTEVTNKLPVDNPTIVNEPKQDTVEKNTVVTINTTETANIVRINSATEAIDNPMFLTQVTEVINNLPVTDNPTIANESKQDTFENSTVVTINTTDAANDVRTNSVTEAIDNSMPSAQFDEVTNKSSVADNPTIVIKPKQGIVENNTVIINNTTEAAKDVRSNSITETIDNSMPSAQFDEVTNKTPVTDNPIHVNEPKKETVENNTVAKIYATDASNDARTNSVTEAIDRTTSAAQFTEVPYKAPVTDNRYTVDESKQANAENNTVYTTTAPYDIGIILVTEVINNSTPSVNFTMVTNESRGTDSLNIVNETKQEIVENGAILQILYKTTTRDNMRENSDTEAIDNSIFSEPLTGVTNESPVADYVNIGNGYNQEVAENSKLLTIHTTTAPSIVKKELITDAVDNSVFSNHVTGVTTESTVTAYPDTVEGPKQETAYTITAPNDIGTNSVTGAKDISIPSEHFTKATTELAVTAYPKIVNELKQNNDVNVTLLTSHATAPDNVKKESVTEAIDNSAFSDPFTGVTTRSPVNTYPSNIGGRTQTIVENSKLLMVHTTMAPDIVPKNSDTEAIDNTAFSAHLMGVTHESPVDVFSSTVNEPKQESDRNSAISPIYTTSASDNENTNSGTESIVKNLTTVSDLFISESAGLITENNTRIDHVTAKIGVTNQENITTDFTNPPKNLETFGEFSSTNERVDTVQDAAETTAYTNNLKNSVTKLFPLKVMETNKTNSIAFVNKDIGTAPNTAMNPDALPIKSVPEMSPSNKFVAALTRSMPDSVDTVSSKYPTKAYEHLLMDGPPNTDINGHSTTAYLPETSTAFAIDGTVNTNIKKLSSFVATTKAPQDSTQKTYTQSKITSVTTKTTFSSLGTSVDWNASGKTDKVNTETVMSKVNSNDDAFKTDTEPIRNTTDKIASPTVINNKDKSIKIVSESDFVNSSDAIPNRKLELSNINPLLSADYFKTTNPQDSSGFITTADYIPVYNFAQVEQPVTKKFEGLQQKPTTIVDLLKSITKTHTLSTVEVNTENIKRVSSTEAPLPRNTVFKGINPANQDFNYVTEKLNIFVSSQEPILSKLNKIPKADSQPLEIKFMASTTTLPKTFKTYMIGNKETINDASIFITSSTQPVPVKNNLKINKELPILSSNLTETKTTEYYSVKSVLPITEVPFVKTTTIPSQPIKILTQTMSKSVGEINKDLPDVIKTTKFMIPTENNKTTRSIKGKPTETLSLVTEPDSMVETIKVEGIPNTIVSYTSTDNSSNKGVKVGKIPIDHESIVIGNVYKNNGLTQSTDFKLPEDNFKVETLSPETEWIKSDIDTVKVKETSVEEDSSKLPVFKSKSGPPIKRFSQVKPKVNQTAGFIQLTSVTISPTATQIESAISKTEPKPITKENKKTVINSSIRANNKTSDGKSQFQEALKNTTDNYHMNNAKVNVTTSYHKLSLQNNTFNDDLAEHLISTNHTITTEVQSHLNESNNKLNKQSNKTSYAETPNINSTDSPNNTGLKINSGDKGNSSISVSTPQIFSCLNRTRGKYSDKKDCRKFYTCIGNLQPMIGTCPNNTVFSEINKQCTRNLSHCVRNNQFRCLLEGRFSDFFKDNIYYICVKNSSHGFIRYTLKCQSGYHLNKATVKCEKDEEISTQSASSISEANNEESTTVKIKSDKITKTGFECESEGKFPYDKDCKKYYVCTKIKKGYQWKIKKCGNDEVYDKKKKKCVDSDSGEC